MDLLLTAMMYFPPLPTATADISGTSWFQTGGLVLVTLITVAILAMIFRPTVKALIEEQSRQPDEDVGGLGFPEIKPIVRVDGPFPAPQSGLLRFPTRLAEPEVSEDTFTAAAASERLRRLTTDKLTIPPGHQTERRRLGTRRTDTPGTQFQVVPDREWQVEPPTEVPIVPEHVAPDVPVTVPMPVEASAHDPSAEQDDAATGPAVEPSDEVGDQEIDDLAIGGKQQSELAANGEEEGAEMRKPESPDDRDLIGELANRLPSEADQSLLDKSPRGFAPLDADLLGDIANRLPSEADRVSSERPAKPHVPPKVSRDIPTRDEVDRIASESSQSGKIVQFVPRPIPPLEEPLLDDTYQILNEREPAGAEEQTESTAIVTRIPVDLGTREAVTSTVQELLFCANVGEFIHGFGLYTDQFLFKFMDDSGLDEDEFRKTFSEIPPKYPGDWTRIDLIDSIQRLDDGRISARVRYIDGSHPDGTEDFTFKFDNYTQRWLIDDIQAV